MKSVVFLWFQTPYFIYYRGYSMVCVIWNVHLDTYLVISMSNHVYQAFGNHFKIIANGILKSVDETHQSASCSKSFRRWLERHWYIVFLHTWWPFPCMCVWRGQFWVFLMQIKSPSNRCPMGQKLLLQPKSLYTYIGCAVNYFYRK